jgi:hypothetical protein
MQITEEESTNILCIQKPYTMQNKVAGVPNKFGTYVQLPGARNRAAIVVPNNHIDALLLKQH